MSTLFDKHAAEPKAKTRRKKAATVPLYSVGTWDSDLGAYTPQVGLTYRCFNITLAQLRQNVRDLKAMGYSAHRVRRDGEYEDNDWCVLIERTDGKRETEIRKEWRR
jgi:hypothetical protein